MSAASRENAPAADTLNTTDLEIGDPSPSGGESDITLSPDSEVSLTGEETRWKPDHTAPEPGEEPQYLGYRNPPVQEAAPAPVPPVLVINPVPEEIGTRAGTLLARRGAGRSVVSVPDITPRRESPGPQVPNGQ